MNIKQNKKQRMIMLQQQTKYLSKDWLKPVEAIAKKYTGFEYAYIVHNQDVDEEGKPVAEHVHLMARFGSSAMTKTLQEWADMLEVPVSAIQKWNRWNNGLSYLIHETNEAKNKHQYNVEEVHANFDYEAALTKIRKDVEINDMYEANDALDELVLYPINGMVERRNELKRTIKGSQRNTFWQQSKALIYNALDDVPAKQLEHVVWIYGPTGTGKTQLALALAEQWGDFYITGADTDSLQGYQFQDTWIIDDMRPEMFNSIGEFLRLLDPNAYSRVGPARYHNVNLGLVENIIITAPVPPAQMFEAFYGGKSEDAMQLIRRLTDIIPIGVEDLASA